MERQDNAGRRGATLRRHNSAVLPGVPPLRAANILTGRINNALTSGPPLRWDAYITWDAERIESMRRQRECAFAREYDSPDNGQRRSKRDFLARHSAAFREEFHSTITEIAERAVFSTWTEMAEREGRKRERGLRKVNSYTPMRKAPIYNRLLFDRLLFITKRSAVSHIK